MAARRSALNADLQAINEGVQGQEGLIQGYQGMLESRKSQLALLNEACTLKNTTDETFLLKIAADHKDNKFFEVPNLSKGKPTTFVIKHYAGDVMYKVDGFLDKNND